MISAENSAMRQWASLFSGKYHAMLVVYTDETGTGGVPDSGEEPAPGVYGFIATPEEWDVFRVKWKAGLDLHKAAYFHFRETRQSHRQNPKKVYFGWTNEQVDDFIYDMATIASSGPIPFGGNVSQLMTVGPNPDKFQIAKLYRKTFYAFFEDFKEIMNDYFPKETEQVSFFFSDIDNDPWIKILNQVMKDVRHHNPLIASEYVSICPKSERGIPCQAADLLAYVNRQNSSKMYEAGHVRSLRLLDLIIARQLFRKTAYMKKMVEMPENEWRDLVIDMRRQKKEFDLKNADADKNTVYYRPIREHPFFKDIARHD